MAEYQAGPRPGGDPVSYTHLDVYKRQVVEPCQDADLFLQAPTTNPKWLSGDFKASACWLTSMSTDQAYPDKMCIRDRTKEFARTFRRSEKWKSCWESYVSKRHMIDEFHFDYDIAKWHI